MKSVEFYGKTYKVGDLLKCGDWGDVLVGVISDVDIALPAYNSDAKYLAVTIDNGRVYSSDGNLKYTFPMSTTMTLDRRDNISVVDNYPEEIVELI